MEKRNLRGKVASRIDWRLCFIADSEAAQGREILALIRKAVEGGVTLVQIRGKVWRPREFLEIGIKAARMLKRRNVPLIINDRIEIALACGADGVHLGQEDLPLPYARKLLGKSRIIGISVNTVQEAIRAEKEGADYVGVGPIFFTSSKKKLSKILGIEGLKKIRASAEIPILAIGGINAENAREIMEAGADGIAVISAIAGARDVRQAATKLIELIKILK